MLDYKQLGEEFDKMLASTNREVILKWLAEDAAKYPAQKPKKTLLGRMGTFLFGWLFKR
jgi:hypothetical protein